jgi:hypothetical protein
VGERKRLLLKKNFDFSSLVFVFNSSNLWPIRFSWSSLLNFLALGFSIANPLPSWFCFS